jgi:hypothetical protein
MHFEPEVVHFSARIILKSQNLLISQGYMYVCKRKLTALMKTTNAVRNNII